MGNVVYTVVQTLTNLLIHGDTINQIYCSDKIISLLERITNTEEEFIIGVLYNREGNLGYGEYSKYLAYSIEIQVVGFGIQA